MSISVSMPQLGESVTEGTIGRWLKSVGDHVDLDEPIVEIITDKVNVEVPSPAAGVVVLIVAAEGQTMPVGSEIAIIDEAMSEPVRQEAESQPNNGSQSTSGAIPTPPVPMGFDPLPKASTTEPVGSSIRNEINSGTTRSRAAGPSVATRTTPFVRHFVEEYDIDLNEVVGSGLGGRVTRDDILSILDRRGVVAAPVTYETGLSGTFAKVPMRLRTAVVEPVVENRPTTSLSRAPEEWIALSPRRRAIAENTSLSANLVPHARVSFEIDMSGVAQARFAMKDDFLRREGFALSYLPFVAKAIVDCIRSHSWINGAFETNKNGAPGVRTNNHVNLSVAVGLDEGLMVPVIRAADGLSIAGIARAANDLLVRARNGRLVPDDLTGGTFTLNNTGALGSIMSDPLLNAGQAAMMTMEAIVRRPVVVTHGTEEAVVIRSMMISVLTFDHRVLDGLQAGEFMRSVKKSLESVGTATSIY